MDFASASTFLEARELLEKKNAELFRPGTSRLHLAVLSDEQVVASFLDYEVNTIILDSKGQTLLYFAIKCSSPDILAILLGDRANVTLQNHGGMTELHFEYLSKGYYEKDRLLG